MNSKRLTFHEFFAGGGMARIGLGSEWTCSFANEWCEKKAASYRAFFGGSELRVCDVADLKAGDLPGVPVKHSSIERPDPHVRSRTGECGDVQAC